MNCPCKSGKHFSECCFPILDTAPPDPKTEYSNENCYAKAYNNCSQKLSKEHIFGKGVTKIIKEANPLENGDIAFIDPDYIPNIPPENFVSNILCERHNNALNKIDNIGQTFIRILYGKKKKNEINFISGYELERWMLKVLCNVSASGNWFLKGNRVKKLKPHPIFLKILFEGFPFPEGWGLYIAKKIKYRGPLVFSVSPLIGHSVHGLEFKMGYIQLFFTIEDARNVDDRLIYHPLSVILDLSEAGKREINLLW